MKNWFMEKRFGKIWMACLLVLIGCISCALSVRADVIWEPEDSFYQEHASECTYVNRWFTANGPDGKVILYQSPEMPIETGSWENGYQAYIAFVYTDSDGIEWGIYDNDAKLSGWVPMAYMEVVYDSLSFQQEHSGEITEQSGELECKDGEEIYLWKYPGAEDFQTFESQEYPPSYHGVYEDAEGHRWGHVGYYFGIKDKWVCIDRPGAEFAALYPEGAPGAEQKGGMEDSEKADSDKENPGGDNSRETERIVPKRNGRVVTIAVVMVAAVVLGTAALLVIMKKRQPGKQEEIRDKSEGKNGYISEKADTESGLR